MPESRTFRWYPGWNIVAAASVLTLITVGMRMGVGPFFLPMTETLCVGRGTLAGIVAIGMLCYGAAMPLAGWLVPRVGTRWVLMLGTMIVVASSVWTTQATDLTQFTLAFGVVMSVGLGLTSPVALTPVISRWFTRQRGMALFFLSTGSMAGIAVVTPIFTASIAAWGWQHTLLGYAAVFALVTVPAALLVIREDAPERTDLLPGQNAPKPSSTMTAAAGDGPSFAQAVASVPFWQVVLGLFTCGFSMNLMGTHGVPMLMDHGFDAMTSSTGIGLVGFVAIFGTLFLGRLADRMERRALLAIIYAVRGLGFLALVSVGAQWELYLSATVGGLAWAGSIALSSAILADVYGVRLVGMLYGWAYFGHQVGAMISSWLGGWGYERWGSHWPAFGAAAVLLLAAAALSLRLPPRGAAALATARTAHG